MIELKIKTPVANDVIFSDLVTINYEVRDTDGLFSSVVFQLGDQLYEKTSRVDLFNVSLSEGNHTLICYIKNKYGKELPNTRKTIYFSTKPITLELKNKLSSVVSSTIPDFLQYDYGIFVEFVKEYYRWLESSKNVNYIPHSIEQFLDVDTVPPELIDKFYETYLAIFPKKFASDKETGNSVDVTKIIKRIRDFYKKKGTEDSFRFLFRLMFDTEITLSYPREKIITASQGRWYVPTLIRIQNLTEDNCGFLIGKEIYGFDANGNKSFFAVVEDVSFFFGTGRNVTTAYLSDVYGELTDSSVYYDEINEGITEQVELKLFSMITGTQLNECPNALGFGKYDFKYGDKLILFGYGSTTKQICSGCTPNVDYPQTPTKALGSGFRGIVEEVNELGEIQKVKILDPGYDYTEENISFYNTQLNNPNPENENNPGPQLSYDCRIIYQTGYLFKDTGRYTSKKTLLSEVAILPDNFYYQQNSYEIGAPVTPLSYSEILKQTAHPAGYKAFYRYDVLDTLQEARNLFSAQTNGSTPLLKPKPEPTLGVVVEQDTVTSEDIRLSSRLFDGSESIGNEPPIARKFVEIIIPIEPTTDNNPTDYSSETGPSTDSVIDIIPVYAPSRTEPILYDL